MNELDLGKLELIDPREIWETEDRDFTPWLADNIDELSNELGIDLEVEDTEVSAGSFSADILAKDIRTDRYVIIENQLEQTDHDHLGKSITYAAVLNASTIIWITKEFREEHKKALDWLNDLTNEEISFYGIKLELWKIDDSKKAVKFNIISEPNRTVKTAKTETQRDISETKKLQENFWKDFKEKLEQTGKFPSLRDPRPQNWYDISIGSSNTIIRISINTKINEITCGIYIDDKNNTANEDFQCLEDKKEEIEEKMEMNLKWGSQQPKSKSKKIDINRSANLENPEKMEEVLNWLVEYTIKFKEVFSEYI
jgi:hypothetical protein